jgi:hypothetical protein
MHPTALILQISSQTAAHELPCWAKRKMSLKGFEFLEYRFNVGGLAGVAKANCERFAALICRLYEQGVDVVGISESVQRWMRWLRSGLRLLVFWRFSQVQIRRAAIMPCVS